MAQVDRLDTVLTLTLDIRTAISSWSTELADWVAGDGAGAVYFTGGNDGASIGKFMP